MAPDLATDGIEVQRGERSFARVFCDLGPRADFLPVLKLPRRDENV